MIAAAATTQPAQRKRQLLPHRCDLRTTCCPLLVIPCAPVLCRPLCSLVTRGSEEAAPPSPEDLITLPLFSRPRELPTTPHPHRCCRHCLSPTRLHYLIGPVFPAPLSQEGGLTPIQVFLCSHFAPPPISSHWQSSPPWIELPLSL